MPNPKLDVMDYFNNWKYNSHGFLVLINIMIIVCLLKKISLIGVSILFL